jgi:hypothetical protein
MGTADGRLFRAPERPFKWGGKGRKAKIFPTARLGSRICQVRENLRKTRLWRICDELPDRRKTGRETSMSQGLIWLYAVAQGLGVLALNVALRVLVS